MEKRKRPKLKMDTLKTGTKFYYYRRPITGTSKKKPAPGAPPVSEK